MANHTVRDNQGRVISILTMADIYEYQGFIFQMHRYCGPSKLKKDWEPAARMGRKFWSVWKAWNALTPEEKSATQIAG